MRNIKAVAGFLMLMQLLWGMPPQAQEIYYGEVQYTAPEDMPEEIDLEGFHHINLEIAPNMTGAFDFPELEEGDTVEVQLNNPSIYPLVFQTANQQYGENKWLVAPQTIKTVRFLYNPSAGEEVRYVVLNPLASEVTEDVITQLNVAELGEVHYEELTLNVGEGDVTLWQLERGDKLVLSLYNPTQWYVLFDLTDPNVSQPVLIPPLSSRTVSYDYMIEPAFGDEVRYEVTLERLTLD